MRRQKTVVIDAEGRDKGKTFLLTEMPAAHAEDWAARAFLMLAHSAIDFPVGIDRAGMAGIAEIAHLLSGVQFSELKPLMDELLLMCVQRIEDPLRPFPRAVDSEDVEEVATRQQLRREAIDLHTNFLLAATILNLIAAASEMTTLQSIESTPTSPRRSARRSRAA